MCLWSNCKNTYVYFSISCWNHCKLSGEIFLTCSSSLFKTANMATKWRAQYCVCDTDASKALQGAEMATLLGLAPSSLSNIMLARDKILEAESKHVSQFVLYFTLLCSNTVISYKSYLQLFLQPKKSFSISFWYNPI